MLKSSVRPESFDSSPVRPERSAAKSKDNVTYAQDKLHAAKSKGDFDIRLICNVSTLRRTSGLASRQSLPLRFMLRLRAEDALRSARTVIGVFQHPAKNLLRNLVHPQGVGRWVPGGKAATLPLAALRGVGFRGS